MFITEGRAGKYDKFVLDSRTYTNSIQFLKNSFFVLILHKKNISEKSENSDDDNNNMKSLERSNKEH